MPVTQSGDPIHAGDTEHTLLFTGLNYDWAGAGRTVKLRVILPSGQALPDTTLIAVSGETEQAKITAINGMFSEDGPCKAQLRLYEGSTFIRASVMVPIVIHEVI